MKESKIYSFSELGFRILAVIHASSSRVFFDRSGAWGQTKPLADPRMVRIGTAPPPFWQINHANSAYFRLFWGYFGVISATRPPPPLDLGPLFLHILDPALN